ncbi:uncharacterized protein LOC133295218 [Gastrolobium bilobum]|uniref:uncharacterized protein LOC133295218 n=1 Tax=Gastrolobium bilobum TaxID=150636 RepID=UPI002AB00BBF|nr:uncharacterized protein LOC133295218 [Gastrolobium bilobum]
MAGIKLPDMDQIQCLTGFPVGQFPFRFLGVPLLASRLNVCHYDPMIARITALIHGWNRKTLSYAGRLDLVRAVIQGIANFWLGNFPLPLSVIHRINASCRNFLWGKTDEGKKRPLVSWSIVCSPKEEGGLGLFCLKTWNNALLTRTLWDFHIKKDSLWVKWIQHYYFKDQSFWECNASSFDSAFMKRVFYIRDCIAAKETNTSDAVTVFQSWVRGTKLVASNAYSYFRQSKPLVPWKHIVWNPAIPPKMSFILWLAVNSKLLTLDKAPYLNKGQTCYLCKSESESNGHLFFACPLVLQVWSVIREWSLFPKRNVSLKGTIDKLKRCGAVSGVFGKQRCLSLSATVYCIWLTRNSVLFYHGSFFVNDVISKIQFLVYRHSHLTHLY